MKFYRENKVNPFASCLPLVAQLPVFLALFYMLQRDLRHDICPDATRRAENPPCGDGGDAEFLFIPDLTDRATAGPGHADRALRRLAAPLDAADVDDHGQDAAPDLPGAAVLLRALRHQFPAGLLVYWITTNLWTIVQQAIVRKRLGPMRPPGPEPRAGLGDMIKQARGRRRATRRSRPADGAARRRRRERRQARGWRQRAEGPARAAPPPPPPRKKKKRSGRRR